MQLDIPPLTIVFRRVHDNGNKGPWHIMAGSRENGFTEKTHPSLPMEWYGSRTYRGLCDKREDDRVTAGKYEFDGFLEFSSVGQIKNICPSCWPFSRIDDPKEK
jgi:hypothetical protein